MSFKSIFLAETMSDEPMVSDQQIVSDEGIVLPENMTIAAVEELHSVLASPQFEQRLKIDASGVKLIDMAGLQLLLAAQKRLSGHGGCIEWLGMSSAVKEAIAILGLTENLAG